MNFQEALEQIYQGHDISYNDKGGILFSQNGLLYYKLKEQTKDEAVLKKQQPTIFSGLWMTENNYQLAKESFLKSVRLGRKDDKLIIIEIWQIKDELVEKQKEVHSIRDYLLSLGPFKDVEIELK